MKKYWPGSKVIFYMMAVLIFAGCGLKANPVPAASGVNKTQDEPALSASVKDGVVELTWTSLTGNVAYVKVEKSEMGITGKACQDCPQTYKGIAELTSENERRYVDRSVERGKSYRYRLSLCNENGACHSSQTAQVDMK